MPGAGLTAEAFGKARPDRLALKPYWGKPTVRNFRGGDGNVGIIRSPVRPIVLPDCIREVEGDRYAGAWVAQAFEKLGVEYRAAERSKSDLYLDFLPLVNAGRAELRDVPRLATQLLGLERRTSRGGRDNIDHAPGGHDDLANAVAGALVIYTI